MFPARTWPLLLSLPFAASCGGAGIPDTCNGHVELCSRRLDEVALPATHNSFADVEHQIIPSNQTQNITAQLEAGIRGLMIDTYYDPNDSTRTLTCHGICLSFNLTLEEELRAIADFMALERDAVIVIVFESYISDDDTDAAFVASGLADYTYAHTLGQPWPTLGELVQNDTRLVVLTDNQGGTETGPYPYYMDQWRYAFQNPYSATSLADFATIDSCSVDRGSAAANTLFVMNHFLTAPLASFDLSAMANPYASLGTHVKKCQTERGRIPNLVTVDFYETGDLFWVVDELNGFVSGPPP